MVVVEETQAHLLRRRRRAVGLRRRRDLLAHPFFGGADRRLRRLHGARRLRLVGLRALLARHLDQARPHRRQLLASRASLAARVLELRARVDAGLVDEPRLLGELRRRCLLRLEGGVELVAFLHRVLEPRAQLGDLAVELRGGMAEEASVKEVRWRRWWRLWRWQWRRVTCVARARSAWSSAPKRATWPSCACSRTSIAAASCSIRALTPRSAAGRARRRRARGRPRRPRGRGTAAAGGGRARRRPRRARAARRRREPRERPVGPPEPNAGLPPPPPLTGEREGAAAGAAAGAPPAPCSRGERAEGPRRRRRGGGRRRRRGVGPMAAPPGRSC